MNKKIESGIRPGITLEADGTLVVPTTDYRKVKRVLVENGTEGSLFYPDGDDEEPANTTNIKNKETDMTYKMKNISKPKLEKIGFREYRLFSSPEETYYVYRFPVCRYREIVTIEAEIMICLQTGIAKIDVFDKGTRSRYASWYCKKAGYGSSKVVDEIEALISKKCKDIGLKEIKE